MKRFEPLSDDRTNNMSSKGKKKKGSGASSELSVADPNDKKVEVSERVRQAAEKFARATKNFNEALLRIKQLNKKILT